MNTEQMREQFIKYANSIGCDLAYTHTEEEGFYFLSVYTRELWWTWLAAMQKAVPERRAIPDDKLLSAILDTSMAQMANCGYPSPKSILELARAIEGCLIAAAQKEGSGE